MGLAILCEPYDPETKKSLIAIPDQVRTRSTLVETRMKVLEISPQAWADGTPPTCQVGDIVLVSKYCGATAKSRDGKFYRLINRDDIYCLADPDVPVVAEDFEAGAA